MPPTDVSWYSRWPSRLGLVLACVFNTVACGATVDSLGTSEPREASARKLQALRGPSSYPNALRDIGKTDEEISAKLAQVFKQLFHGNPSSESIYFPVGTDEANVQDSYHSNEIRTEGVGLGMLIAVELDKQTEFNNLWRYAKAEMMEASGPTRGYFKSYCDTSYDGVSSPPGRCWDPYGLQQFVTALMFAHDRWSNQSDLGDAGMIDYEADVWLLLDTMRFKERDNGGVVGGITNTFDAATGLVFNEPVSTSSNFTKPSSEMPAYYELWAQATGDPFWLDAAASARAYWRKVANPTTGLFPIRAYFSGAAYPSWDMFAPECYRTQLNIALDQVWNGKDPWEVTEANALLGFFARFNGGYGRIFRLDGTQMDGTLNEPALIASNGMTALIATDTSRVAFINAVWNAQLITGLPRYYSNILQLLSLLVLSGQFRVY